MADPLLLLPGLLCDEALWRPQIDHLTGRVVCHVADTKQDDTLAAMARRALADAPDRFALAGLSMGGYLAMEILRQAPDRVSRLALLDTTARPDTDEQKERRRALMHMARQGRFKGVTPRLLPLLIHPDRLEDKSVTLVVMEMATRTGREAFLAQQNAILTRIDSRPFLPQIAVPTLVIVGRQDALTPPDRAEEMAALIPGARLEIIEQCGHLPTLERPDQVNSLFEDWFA